MANVQPCPCCGTPLGQRQINRHLARFAANLTALDRAADMESDSDSDSDPAPDSNSGSGSVLSDNNVAGDGGDDLMDVGQALDDDELAGKLLRPCIAILANY